MTRRLPLLVVMFVVFNFFLHVRSSESATQEKVVLIFCDVTSSLDSGERSEVAQMAAEVVRNMKPPARYQILPILLDTDRANVIVDEKVPLLVKPSDKNQYRAALALLPKYLEDQLSKVYAEANGRGIDPNRSCIINALERASDVFNQYREAENFLELVIISDMIEECSSSAYGATIRLAKADIRKEIETARKDTSLGNLQGVRISLVIPPMSASSKGYVRPPLRQLREFWKAVFSQAGVSSGDLVNVENFYIGIGLPERLRRQW